MALYEEEIRFVLLLLKLSSLLYIQALLLVTNTMNEFHEPSAFEHRCKNIVELTLALSSLVGDCSRSLQLLSL